MQLFMIIFLLDHICFAPMAQSQGLTLLSLHVWSMLCRFCTLFIVSFLSACLLIGQNYPGTDLLAATAITDLMAAMADLRYMCISTDVELLVQQSMTLSTDFSCR